ncbi:hypothetical protein KP509_03G008500 [Ceratopteris richardii]|uniref:Uncharacterized protein n=1 Tax=Ceratopteris richardii TaxID=49495 RepID=A0A8T2UX68_CERRI|nr:hypothetical protein KP509_03G008500 [Ceratopteris richardii]KAH7440744.1 hypothetical protein KP509_03G008500 [Ceratopteris richardii]KAH7440745.1 hypothetical protein KP509_03G008500 [Ceratopteris richardii]KAH7440746.1 hypothetical protein KP509_03G008500 [Ceratopteris richardii]KAH7440747.1 hypothetical protein KP509_03G008500 [Ceratopteris richardii]
MENPSKESCHIAWREMYQSASSMPREETQSLSLYHRRTKSLSADQNYKVDSSHSVYRLNHLNYHSEGEGSKSRSFSYVRDPPLMSSRQKDIAICLPHSLSFSAELHDSATPSETGFPPQENKDEQYSDAQSSTLEDRPEEKSSSWSLDPERFQLAIYVAMAHGLMGLLILVLYGLWMLLDEYRKPIQWAVLCSMPLREIQKALVQFWEIPLKQGILQTVCAIPCAVIKAFVGTIMDARISLHYLLGFNKVKHHRQVGFSTLMQWLVSFAIFTLGYEFFGPAPLVTAAFLGMLVYAAGASIGLITPLSTEHPDGGQVTWSMLSGKHQKLRNEPRLRPIHSIVQFFKLVNMRCTSSFLGSLHFVTAVFLILMLILASLAGPIIFSYKVGMEGKDAVLALKARIEKSNYAEHVGLKKWIEENKVSDVIETYTSKAYDSITEQIDGFAALHNLTGVFETGKRYLLKDSGWKDGDEGRFDFSFHVGPSPILVEYLQKIRSKFSNYDFKGAYYELEKAGLALLEHFHISKEDLRDKVRQWGRRWLDVGKQVAISSSTILVGSMYFMVSVAYSIASGAAGVLRFFMQGVVFFSVLYYLIVSETGGVMKQVLSIVPLSESTRNRCASVLEDTVSSVLLSTAKAALFQAVFTWLLFRFFGIHFLYMSTLLALLSKLLSLPFCFQASSLLGVAQLAVEGRYIESLVLIVVHNGVVRYALAKICKGSPHHNFAGLSLAVGIVLFWHSPERAIIGPLIITLLVAVKNLYLEFILKDIKQS